MNKIKSLIINSLKYCEEYGIYGNAFAIQPALVTQSLTQ